MNIRKVKGAKMNVMRLIALIVCSVVLLNGVMIKAEEVPPIPEGYSSELVLKTVMLTGQLELVDAKNVELPDSIEEHLGIEFGMGGDTPLELDLYLPKERNQNTPAILFIHGGAWKGGKRGDMKYYCVKFAEQGYITATVSYRLVGVAPFPAAVEDVKCAVRWLRANAEKYQIDADKIAVSGNSAGGHLALMVGYVDDPVLEGNGGNPGVSSQVCAVVNFYGPTDLTTDFAKSQSLVTDFLGGKTYDEAPEMYHLASPIFHLDEQDPPTLIFHGTLDSTVPIKQADLLAERLEELGVDYIYERYEGWPHVMDLAVKVNRRCLYQMTHFFDEYLPVK